MKLWLEPASTSIIDLPWILGIILAFPTHEPFLHIWFRVYFARQIFGWFCIIFSIYRWLTAWICWWRSRIFLLNLCVSTSTSLSQSGWKGWSYFIYSFDTRKLAFFQVWLPRHYNVVSLLEAKQYSQNQMFSSCRKTSIRCRYMDLDRYTTVSTQEISRMYKERVRTYLRTKLFVASFV
jgi:hypothetical protein